MPKNGKDVHNISYEWAWSQARLAVRLPPRIDFIGKNVCYAGGRVYIDGYTGEGKSMWGLGLAQAIAARLAFGVWQACPESRGPVRVLYLDYEMGRATIQERLKWFGSDDLAVVCFDDPEIGERLHPIDTPEGQLQVGSMINELQTQVVVIDNLYAACAGDLLGGAGKSSGGWAAHERIVPWARDMSQAGVCTIWLQHSNEEGKAYGDKRIARQMFVHLHLERLKPLDMLKVQVTMIKNRGAGKSNPWIMSWREDSGWCLDVAATTPRRSLKGHLAQFVCAVNDAPVVEWPRHPDIPRTAAVRSVEDVRVVFEERVEGMPATKHRQFRRMIALAMKRQLVVRCAEWCWPIE